jgi:ABC-type bacteriocin/lantibiotic exporter with double-glycine peptidase domain
MKGSPIKKDFLKTLYRVSLASFFIKLVAVPAGLVQAQLTSDVVISATKGDFYGVLKKGGLIILLILLVKIFEFVTQVAYQEAKSNAIHKCKLDLYKQYFSSPLSLLYSSSAGQAAVIFKNDFNTLTNMITEVRPGTISAFTMVVAYASFICVQSRLVACILVGVSLAQIIPPLIFKRLYKKYDVEDKEIEKQSSDSVLELYNGFTTIRMFRLKKRMLSEIKHLHDKWWGVANRLQATSRTEEAVNKTIGNLLTYGTYAIIGILILVGFLETEAGIQAIALSSGLYGAVKTVFSSITKFSVANVAETRMTLFWSQQTSPKQMLSSEADITFSDVSCVLDDKTIFSGLNLSLPLNGVTIIRGENGSGKSTLIKLALGMIEGQSGDIQTSGINPSLLSYDNFPRKIFFLPQEDALYNLTPSEMYQMILNKDEIEIARSLGAQFGLSEEMYERIIPELSGGERKKVFLSLAFAVNPEVLILDEPTNSLDEASSQALYDLLSERNKGAIIITHNGKLASVGSVIYNVQKGGIVLEKNSEKTNL